MSGFPNYGMPPGDENQSQTGNRDQNPGQYHNENDSTQENLWDTFMSNIASEPGESSFDQSAGQATWEQQTPISPGQQANQPNPLVQGDPNDPTQDVPERRVYELLRSIFRWPVPDPQPQARARGCRWAIRMLEYLATEYRTRLEGGKFDHSPNLGASSPLSFGSPGSTGLDLDNTWSSDPQVPIPRQQHEPHSIAGHPNVVNARPDHDIDPLFLPDPQISQPSLAGPSTGGQEKRGRAASPDTTAPAPKRTRNLSPNASGAEGSNANSSGIPIPTPNTTSSPSRQPQITRKRKAGTDGEEDDGEDDLLSHPRPQKKPRGEPAAADKSNSQRKKQDNELAVKGTVCNFCDESRGLLAGKPCDWKQVLQTNGSNIYNIECTNCADHRSQNKDNTELAEKGGHKCQVPGPETLIHFKYKRYGAGDPNTYEKKTCDTCKRTKRQHTCDVDTILGYGCHNCRRDGECAVDGVAMLFRRPNKLTRRPWYRHPCDRCLLRHKEKPDRDEEDCCSWIKDRGEWEGNRACAQCQRDGAICLDLGAAIGPFSEARENSPKSWEIRKQFEADKENTRGDKSKKEKSAEYAEVLTNTTWRKPCQGCQTAGKGTDCLVMWFQPNHACERCTQFGIDCMVPEEDRLQRRPIFDLSRVGFGQFTPYQVCQQCLTAGRNCDRQRPCDSCIQNSVKCDAPHWTKPGCINRRKLAGREDMKKYNPGPLYYLALGYGPKGVNDLKDGRSLEHWIGPTAPMYGLVNPRDGPQRYKSVADAHRSHRPPAPVAPPARLQPGMELKCINAQSWAMMIRTCWLNSQPQPPESYPQPPESYHQAYKKAWSILRNLQDSEMKKADIGPNLSIETAVRSFQGGPVLTDIDMFQSLIPSAAHQNPHAAQSQGTTQLPPNQPSMQDGLPYNPQQSALGPQAEPFPIPHLQAANQPGDYTAVQPSLGPADQQTHDNFCQESFFQAQNGQQIQQDQDLLSLQDYRNADQQQSDPYSPQIGLHQGLTHPQDDGNLNQQQLDPYSEQTGLHQDQVDPQQDTLSMGLQEILELLGTPETMTQNADDESGEPWSLAKSAIQARVIENDQQERHRGEQEHWRSRANRGGRWHKPQTSRVSKRSSQERTARRKRAPKNANDQVAFNPFLGFTFGRNQKPQSKEKPKSSRWKVFNHLEGIDMSEWHESKYKEPEEESRPRLFSIVNGQTNKPTPLRDVLGDVPREEKVIRTNLYCGEPGEGGWGLCNAWNKGNKGQAICQSHAHRNKALPYFPVCNDCTRGNVKYLFQHEHNPITEGELLSMRAYLCNDCAGQMSSGAPNAVQNQIVGTRRVYGIAADGAHSQNIQKLVNDPSQAAANPMRNTEALTGCSCANRILGTSLCRFHRLYYAEEVMKHAALMQEWRLSRFKKAVCPSCLAQKPSEKVNVSANVDGFVKGAPTAWACVVCNDWVVNEPNDVNSQPKAIDKPLWNLDTGRKLLDPRREITTGRVLGQVVSV